ncbi:CRISPR-associated protein Cas5 [Thermodesulfobacterium commune]|uniref:CRISPR-associated protein Cas5 n=1 Tax=Thermodesulfobacterium commune DSM 2178 TaxID=289377 RepID=A0A075WVT9_9BACT|nr:CRISPR-associated protein Cas5 [Thermodesulfobacterium commune]AIH04573.1 hypothetical protein HL41_07735 [Thermodesulfobacterium commune DSM 2178]
MKAIAFKVRLNSLYSIRIPFTWQSALTYPVLPPSAVIGMFANALQRYKNDRNPLDYLNLVEENIIWAGSRLLTPCLIKSYTTSAITKWEDHIGAKFTNALGRQFAFTKTLEIAGIFKDDTLINELVEALITSPLTCGDSESAISLENKPEDMIKEVEKVDDLESIVTNYPFPFTNDIEISEGKGLLYLMHERCKPSEKNFPLTLYLVPIEEKERILFPTSVTIQIVKKNSESPKEVFKIQDIGYVLKSQFKNRRTKAKIKKRKKN